LDHEAASISRLVLIDAAGYEQPLPFFVGTLRIPIVNRLVLNLVPTGCRARVTLNHPFWNRDRVTPERVRRYARYFDIPGSHASYIAAARHLIPTDHGEVISRIASIEVSTLIIWGERDKAINVSNAHKFARDVKTSRLVVLPNCGHIPHEECPVDTASAIEAFIANRE
jgi:pimeloyl-ACP methyl ester carboxylesterase